ncbi:hypothetical protein SAMN05428959_104638 [Duganella sp. CF517]|uniref:hypothetical protein n=1 Tax=Duganella sp. CF517 TaxID=1881038 RepID=UPI0008BBACB4|nr:hypothetical protein [Duganella sp. CF517]SEO09742.1 hypothetical protein SAMN05428959_104638 [Duganella sp. CF517]
MSDVPATTAPQAGETQTDSAAITSAIEEISVAIATGLVPFLGQAINIYDTITCLLTLHNSTSAEDQMEAKFDLVLALVGWIPGAGGGVKKTIRIVNKHPERFAPILFDVLRMVCDKVGIHTSPEFLLDKLFDAAGLKNQLGTVQSAIEGSWLYDDLPAEGRLALSTCMSTVRAQLPAMVMLVTLKLAHWKTKQRNNAAQAFGPQSKVNPAEKKPEKKDPKVAEAGHNAPTLTASNNTVNASIGTSVIEGVSKSLTGIVGEHITDYFLYEKYGWGKGWSRHDLGTQGEWKEKPSKTFPGKLNEATRLNPLFALKAHGTGIDGVWKVQTGDPHNGGKPYAIVESKASIVGKVPKNASSKPGVKGKLLDNAKRIKDAALPKSEELLEPDTSEGRGSAGTGKPGGKPGGKPAGGKDGTGGGKPSGGSKQAQPKQDAPGAGVSLSSKSGGAEQPLVQMSHRWIGKNLFSAVGRVLEVDIKQSGYSRHLFYTPFYLPSAAEHEKALLENEPGKPEKHTDHDIPSTHRHDEQEVKSAVNHKLAKLSLQLEP